MSAWRTDGHFPGLILVLAAQDMDRVGHCWMKGRLLVGDLVMCLSHAGDCFWRYCIVGHEHPLDPFSDHEYYGDGYRLIRCTEFGSYTIGSRYKWQPNEREFHLLMAGERVTLESETAECGTVQS